MLIKKEAYETTKLYRIRHSLAHLMARAVMDVRKGTKLGFGPPIEDGFYYDFILPANEPPLTDADFPEIEKRIRKMIREAHPFILEGLDYDAAMRRLDDMGEPYKKEYAQELFAKQGIKELTFYRTGRFLDMCEGPHVTNTSEIPQDAFQLRSISGAYWRGDAKNQQMTRVYAWAFESKAELDAHLKEYEFAQTRDHRKLGQELDLFVIDEEIGKGLPLWLPNGTIVRDALEKYMVEMEFKAGFQRVATPHLAKTSLYEKTGHLPYYAPHMYPFMELKEVVEGADAQSASVTKETYVMKPMNCPHHHKIFSARPRSYRELPLRLAEYGQVYRFEESGALSGLLRVRGMCMNDAHIYCTAEQIKSEFRAVMDMHAEVYKTLGITNYWMRFSTWDPTDPKGTAKYVNNPQAWAFSEKMVREAMDEAGLDYFEGVGEGAFYGPKIDFQFRTVTGREETASTCQLDFAIPERLDLSYKGADNNLHRPYIIHRAPLGTHERFVAFLIEHYGGAFPTWLAPVQTMIVPVAEAFAEYAHKLASDLRAAMIRVEVDATNDTLNKRLRNAVTRKIPNILVIGEREVAAQSVTLRRYGIQEQKTMAAAEYKAWLLEQIRTRALSS